ncbi:MAG: hypothetical protein KKA54_20710 [Proteobacteria bacterium]|nr:hypothetical protein [Pseudomonadota bacterium]
MAQSSCSDDYKDSKNIINSSSCDDSTYKVIVKGNIVDWDKAKLFLTKASYLQIAKRDSWLEIGTYNDDGEHTSPTNILAYHIKSKLPKCENVINGKFCCKDEALDSGKHFIAAQFVNADMINDARMILSAWSRC